MKTVKIKILDIFPNPGWNQDFTNAVNFGQTFINFWAYWPKACNKCFKLPRSASWTCCSQSWMKPGFFQCWKILSIFLLILNYIDQKHVKICFSLRTVKISIFDMLLPILDKTRMLWILANFLINFWAYWPRACNLCFSSRSATWTCCSQCWMKHRFSQCWKFQYCLFFYKFLNTLAKSL